MLRATTLVAYFRALPEPQISITNELIRLVEEAAPGLEFSIKSAQPVFSYCGPCIFIKAFPRHVNLGFFRGSELDDPAALLIGDGAQMRHVRYSEVDEIDGAALSALVVQAVDLNKRLGNPTEGPPKR